MAKSKSSPILLVLIVILLSYSIIFILLPKSIPPVKFEIRLQNNELSIPQEGVMFYTVTNNKNYPIINITINNSIIGYESYSYLKDSKSINNLTGKDSYSDKFIIPTGTLTKGNYIIKSHLTYIYQGKNYTEELTLSFKIY